MAKRREKPFVQCDEHDDEYVYYWGHLDECPACVHVRETRAEQTKLRARIRGLNKDVKLLKFELMEERKLHSDTKLDVAEYLAQKQLVDELVRDRVK